MSSDPPLDSVLKTREALSLLGITDPKDLWRRVADAGISPYRVRGQRRGLVYRDYLRLLDHGRKEQVRVRRIG